METKIKIGGLIFTGFSTCVLIWSLDILETIYVCLALQKTTFNEFGCCHIQQHSTLVECCWWRLLILSLGGLIRRALRGSIPLTTDTCITGCVHARRLCASNAAKGCPPSQDGRGEYHLLLFNLKSRTAFSKNVLFRCIWVLEKSHTSHLKCVEHLDAPKLCVCKIYCSSFARM